MFCKIHRNECAFFVHNLQKHKVYQNLSYINKEKYGYQRINNQITYNKTHKIETIILW